jgi:predicted nicotinamide N-methyase
MSHSTHHGLGSHHGSETRKDILVSVETRPPVFLSDLLSPANDQDLDASVGTTDWMLVQLGAGVGLPGICASLLGGQVILTDKEEALMIARANVDANSLSQHVQVSPSTSTHTFARFLKPLILASNHPHPHHPLPPHPPLQPFISSHTSPSKLTRDSITLQVGRLDWGDASSPLAVPYHLVLAADVVYSPDVYGLLNDSLMRCTRPGSLVLLAYRQRNVSDGAFFTLLAQSFSIELAWCSHESPPPAIAEVLGLHGTAECKVTGEWVSTEATAILRMLRLG